MQKKITFRSMDHSDAIENHAYEKLAKLDKFFKREPSPIIIEMVLEAHREQHYFIAELKVNSTHYDLVSKTEGNDMYSMIDEAVHKMVKEISRKKEKMVHDLHQQKPSSFGL